MMLFRPALMALLFVVPAFNAGMADDSKAEDIVNKVCSSCHDVSGSVPSTITEAQHRKAPPLFYAGWKYQRDWLLSWVQNPGVLYPAGYLLPNIVVDENRRDQIDASKRIACASDLSSADANLVVDHLMSLRPDDYSVAEGELEGKVSNRKGYMMFVKQYACIGCHKINYRGEIKGGVSGTDLTNAGKRLNPNWVVDYMDNPTRWIGPSPKPVYTLSAKKSAAFASFVLGQGVSE